MRSSACCLLAAACAAAPMPDAAGTDTSTDTSTTSSSEVTTEASTSSSDSTDTTAPDAGSSGTDESDASSSTGGSPIDEAIDRGIAGTLTLADQDIVLLLLMDAMHRRFAIADFAGAAAQYDATIAELPEPPVDALAFRRIFDPTQTLTAEQLAAIAPGVNEVTVPALFCDVLPFPAAYAERLQQDAAMGGYELTHVALALRWIDELGCAPPVDVAFADQVATDTLALVDASDGLDDLEIEAALFAALLVGIDVLPADLGDAVLAGQLDDGTWPHDAGDVEGDWHTTGLGLFLVLELHRRPLAGFVAT